ncbi:response regulator transcription factor [Rubrivirga sp. S365]|uniref:Response regulator transcription factor n=1 Tax=Rubrivirga litoralis TaxID=3075598 RepID=A0ABU3BN36_9BACT|nr:MULTISPECIES: response regulator transcription factor [unclassified Rubrivirga]MDT0630691.1 response regulator transcription factor [Rubrivirga sp. F394]MDT7856263.1 response regulator transcription factor [Rubrivirga sp. S365]
MKRRVYLVEDHPVTREGLRALVDKTADLAVVGESGAGADVLDGIERTSPDVAVVDITIAGTDGIELTKQIRAVYPDLPVLVLSAHAETVYAERAVRAGARGYVMKQEPPGVLLAAIRSVLDGDLHLSDAMRDRVVGSYLTSSAPASSAVDELTDRELEVFRHFGHGMTTVQVADVMMVSPKTVETHRVHVKQKLGIETTNEFVQRATLWVSQNDA